MAKFKDKSGVEWTIEFDLGLVDDIKNDTGVDLDALTGSNADRNAFGELLVAEHGRKLAEVLWVMCREQAASREIDEGQFFRRFNGPTVQAANEAFLEAFLDFSPRQAMGKAVRSHLPNLLAKTDRLIEAQVNKAAEEFLKADWDSLNGVTRSQALPASGIPAV